jgi:uncharacterized repeat protein (TIGR03803 family)
MRVHPLVRAGIAVLGAVIVSVRSTPAGATPNSAVFIGHRTPTAAQVRLRGLLRTIPGCGATRNATLLLRAAQCSQASAGSTATSRIAAPGVAPTSVLYSFTGREDGGGGHILEVSGLVQDRTGALYGTTYNGGDPGPFCAFQCGVAFKLTPPSPGQPGWKETVIHAFTNIDGDGANPYSGLIADDSGALYGTTQFGGADESGCGGLGCGTIFKLTPPAHGQTGWTQSVLYTFTGVNGDGYGPVSGLFLDSRGALYGTTPFDSSGSCGGLGCGNVFKLTPSGPGQHVWSESILHAFTGGADGANPFAGVIVDRRGNVYGDASGGTAVPLQAGVIFKLTPPAWGRTAWTDTVLYSFGGAPDGNTPAYVQLIGDGNALYGMTLGGGSGCVSANGGGCGLVFRLAPPARGQGPWTESVLHSFNGDDGAFPDGRLLVNRGALYGTTSSGGASAGSPSGSGTVFQLTPPASRQAGWAFNLLHAFTGTPDGAHSTAGLTAGTHGDLYGTTTVGGAYGFGTVFVVR